MNVSSVEKRLTTAQILDIFTLSADLVYGAYFCKGARTGNVPAFP